MLSDRDARARYDRWGHADDGGAASARSSTPRRTSSTTCSAAGAASSRAGPPLHARGHVRGSGVRRDQDDHRCPARRRHGRASSPSSSRRARRTARSRRSAARASRARAAPPPAISTSSSASPSTRRSAATASMSTATTRSRSRRRRSAPCIELPTLDGPVKMRIPEGTQPGRVFRIRGRGIPQASGKNAPRGDHLVHVHVEVPTELTREAARADRGARAGTSGDDRRAPAPPRRKRLLDRVRSLLDE